MQLSISYSIFTIYKSLLFYRNESKKGLRILWLFKAIFFLLLLIELIHSWVEIILDFEI